MAQRDSSQDIDRKAADWTARLDRGPLSRRDEEALQGWLKDDPRNRGALMRAQAFLMTRESALAPSLHFETPKSASVGRLSRRGAFTWAGGAVVAAASLAALGVSLPASGAVIETRKGEMRLLPLGHGSTVLLNTDSRIRINSGDSGRFVTLLEGEAYFSIAHGGDRPFVVEVSGRRLMADQAQFNVRMLDGQSPTLLVEQGMVSFSSPSLIGAAKPVVIGSNMQMPLAAAIGRPMQSPVTVMPERVSRELAWRDGKLAFEGETLAQAVEVFGRYSDTRIVIADPALAREPITGLFAANDPVGFSGAIASVFGATARQTGSTIVLAKAEAGH